MSEENKESYKRILVLGEMPTSIMQTLHDDFLKQQLIPVENSFATHINGDAVNYMSVDEMRGILLMYECEAVLIFPSVNFISQICTNGTDCVVKVYSVGVKEEFQHMKERKPRRKPDQNSAFSIFGEQENAPMVQMIPLPIVMGGPGGPRMGTGGYEPNDPTYADLSVKQEIHCLRLIGSFDI